MSLPLLLQQYSTCLVQVTLLNTNNLQLYGIKYSFLIQIIFKQFYLTHRWNSNSYYHSKSVDLGVMSIKEYSTQPRFPQLVGWVLWHINLCRLFNAKSIFMQIISSILNNSVQYEYTV